MIEFVIFISTICVNNTIYAHGVKMNNQLKIVEDYYVPIVKDCTKSSIIGIIESSEFKIRDKIIGERKSPKKKAK